MSYWYSLDSSHYPLPTTEINTFHNNWNKHIPCRITPKHLIMGRFHNSLSIVAGDRWAWLRWRRWAGLIAFSGSRIWSSICPLSLTRPSLETILRRIDVMSAGISWKQSAIKACMQLTLTRRFKDVFIPVAPEICLVFFEDIFLTRAFFEIIQKRNGDLNPNNNSSSNVKLNDYNHFAKVFIFSLDDEFDNCH